MKTIVVLFNLKPGASVADYERFARERDLPTVGALPSVTAFEVLKAHGLWFGGGPAPYQYIELIRVPEIDALVRDVSTPTMQAIAAEFQGFADAPLFLITEAL